MGKVKIHHVKYKGKITFYSGIGKQCSECEAYFANSVDFRHHKRVCGSLPWTVDSSDKDIYNLGRVRK